jgi:hypothetical protein
MIDKFIQVINYLLYEFYKFIYSMFDINKIKIVNKIFFLLYYFMRYILILPEEKKKEGK